MSFADYQAMKLSKQQSPPHCAIFDEMAPKYEDQGPRGFKPRCQKSLEKTMTELSKARTNFCANGAKEGTDEHKRYKLCQNKYKNLKKRVREEEDKFYHSQIERLKANGDTRRFHTAIREGQNGRYVVDNIERLVGGSGVAHHSDREILALMTDYVANLYAGEGFVSEDDFICDEEFPSYDASCESEIVHDEVAQALRQMQPRKAMCLDQLYAEMFIGATVEESDCFTIASDKILGVEYPSEWKIDRKNQSQKLGPLQAQTITA